MTELKEFYNWLDEQEYWIRRDKVDEKFPEIQLKESTGITMKQDDDGNTLIPRRDLRQLATTRDTE